MEGERWLVVRSVRNEDETGHASWEHTAVPCPSRALAERIRDVLWAGAVRREAEFTEALRADGYQESAVHDLVELYRTRRQRSHRVHGPEPASRVTLPELHALHATSCCEGSGGDVRNERCRCEGRTVLELLVQNWSGEVTLRGQDLPDPRRELLLAHLGGNEPRTPLAWDELETACRALEGAEVAVLLLARRDGEGRDARALVKRWEERYRSLTPAAQEVLEALLLESPGASAEDLVLAASGATR